MVAPMSCRNPRECAVAKSILGAVDVVHPRRNPRECAVAKSPTAAARIATA